MIVEYKDDVFVVPRNTSIIVRRLPASRPGKGTAQRYVLGALPADGKGAAAAGSGMKAGPPGGPERFAGRNMSLNYKQQRVQPQEQPSPAASTTQSSTQESIEPSSNDTATGNDSEDAAIQAMFQQTTDQWGAMQEKLAE